MNIQIAHELPFNLLADYDELFSDYFYALVHLFEEYPNYYSFAVDALKKGRKVILDNSAYELKGQPFDSNKFVGWIEELALDTSSEIVNNQLTYIIPDVFDSMFETYGKTIEFFTKYPNIPGKAMVVCQGNNFDELTKIFTEFVYMDRVTKIGINFMSAAYIDFIQKNSALGGQSQWSMRMEGRQAFLSHLYHCRLLYKKPIHLLGCAQPEEFRFYTKEFPILSNAIESLDTSSPIISGMFSDRYLPVLSMGMKLPNKIADHFLDEIKPGTIKIINSNVEAFRQFNGLIKKEKV